MRNKPRFVFDTNALISVALLPKNVNKLALKKAEVIGDIVFSNETLSELKSVLIRTKFDRYVTLIERLEFLDRLEARYQKINVTSNFMDCRDSKDNKFLNLAFDSEAAAIISGDKDLLVLDPYKNIRILNATDFLNLF
ncbi:putative toxin-antitoxin system toxin component, PIN family [Dyadobacter subterraneus]|uniref:Toxin-antitoxin system toxin component, PIN family n=1 Tax=Dyadobacter subterraneus TaxID=2773304 RepID=A0ABR9W5E5_9BACT|nr:putative toxin-antitoxin system toxin component, PIN family [Dyadobacter subterraneus]MBE9460679.1 putative toxin-antitoxin system toxin component, PIN family [Dyadobacter subterraneus]